MDHYEKYGLVALNAVNRLNSSQETDPCSAWDEAAVYVFPTQLSLRKKVCPRSAFLGLCEEGKVKGVMYVERIIENTGTLFLSKIINLNIEDEFSYMSESLLKAIDALNIQP